MYTFAERLKGFRTREGLSQQALAYKLGVHRNTISAWERGEYLPDTREMVLDLTEALELSPADTNLLLAAAQYPPEPIATGDERGAARFEEAHVGLLVVDRLETGSSAPPGPIPTRVPESRARRLMGRLPDGLLLAEAETGRRAPQPPRGETLFGRDAAKEQLVRELCAAGGSPSLALTALRGLPGVGKTALAKAVANDPRVARSFPDGRAWLELGPQADPFRLLGQALADFGAPVDDLSDVDSRAARLRSVLAGRRALLVLDDVWQAAHAEPLLAAVQPPARALLTTRLPQVAADLHATNHEIEVLSPPAAPARPGWPRPWATCPWPSRWPAGGWRGGRAPMARARPWPTCSARWPPDC